MAFLNELSILKVFLLPAPMYLNQWNYKPKFDSDLQLLELRMYGSNLIQLLMSCGKEELWSTEFCKETT